MAFSSKRGRPRKPPAAPDLGTPELRFKHAHGFTTEPVDVCLAKQLITDAQHRCALHLRWLHTLRYGAESLTCRYTRETETGTAPPNDPNWRALREAEYRDAVQLLEWHRCHRPVAALAIYNHRPPFLNDHLRTQAFQDAAIASALERSYRDLCDGLDLLARLWRR